MDNVVVSAKEGTVVFLGDLKKDHIKEVEVPNGNLFAFSYGIAAPVFGNSNWIVSVAVHGTTDRDVN